MLYEVITKYKEKRESGASDQWIRQIRTLLEQKSDSDESPFSGLPTHPDSESIYVLTPAGDVKQLVITSYSIHYTKLYEGDGIHSVPIPFCREVCILSPGKKRSDTWNFCSTGSSRLPLKRNLTI